MLRLQNLAQALQLEVQGKQKQHKSCDVNESIVDVWKEMNVLLLFWTSADFLDWARSVWVWVEEEEVLWLAEEEEEGVEEGWAASSEKSARNQRCQL